VYESDDIYHTADQAPFPSPLSGHTSNYIFLSRCHMRRKQGVRRQWYEPETAADVPHVSLHRLRTRVEGCYHLTLALNKLVLVCEHAAPDSVLLTFVLLNKCIYFLNHFV
jgi:hypothetical protein